MPSKKRTKAGAGGNDLTKYYYENIIYEPNELDETKIINKLNKLFEDDKIAYSTQAEINYRPTNYITFINNNKGLFNKYSFAIKIIPHYLKSILTISSYNTEDYKIRINNILQFLNITGETITEAITPANNTNNTNNSSNTTIILNLYLCYIYYLGGLVVRIKGLDKEQFLNLIDQLFSGIDKEKCKKLFELSYDNSYILSLYYKFFRDNQSQVQYVQAQSPPQYQQAQPAIVNPLQYQYVAQSQVAQPQYQQQAPYLRNVIQYRQY